MSAVVPLDPDSDHGRAIAARWSRTLALIEHEITGGVSAPPKKGTPAPAAPPKPKKKPKTTKPKQPKKVAA